MKVLVTGASGLLGSALTQVIQNTGWETTPLSRQQIGEICEVGGNRVLKGFDILIHAAANTDVEACERDPQVCYRDNTLMTERLALATRRADCRFVFVSSTGIYGDLKAEPYHEYDAVRPTTHHHRSKWLAEQAVSRLCEDALTVRTGWLFGGAFGIRKNFVARRIEEARAVEGGKIESNQQQRGTPSFTIDVAARIVELISHEAAGTYNCVNSGDASRFEYVSAIIEAAGIRTQVQASPATVFQRLARVSNNEAAINLKAEQCGLPPMRAWQDALKEYVADLLRSTEAVSADPAKVGKQIAVHTTK